MILPISTAFLLPFVSNESQPANYDLIIIETKPINLSSSSLRLVSNELNTARSEFGRIPMDMQMQYISTQKKEPLHLAPGN